MPQENVTIPVNWSIDKRTGLPYFPVTHIDAVRDDDGNPLSAYLNKRSAEYLTCATAGATAAKEIALAGFVLLPNTFYAVLFTNAFVAADATLNINNTGAKPIKYYGVNVPNYVVKDNTILTLVYDGTNYNVTSIERAGDINPDYVDLGLPSGTKWATKNIGADKPEGIGLYYSWGNVDGHHIGDSYDFSSTFPSTAGYNVRANIPAGDTYDPARKAWGNPWRLPTNDEFIELEANCTKENFNLNGVDGKLFTSTINGNSIFMPNSGYWDSEVHLVNLPLRTSTFVTFANNSIRCKFYWESADITEDGMYGINVRAVM